MTSEIKESSDLGNLQMAGPPQRPHTIYLYYFTFRNSQIDTIKAYKYLHPTDPIQNMRQQIERVIRDIINGNLGDHIEYLGNGFNFDRTHKGYFVVALEEAQFTAPNPPNPTNYITFRCNEADIPTSEGNEGKHTFQYRGVYEETISGKDVSYASYLYSAKSYDHGEDLLAGEFETYSIRFGIHFTALVDITYEDDSGGTNMGPPPRPPGFFGRGRD